MKIIIKKPKDVACGVFLPHKDSGERFHSDFPSDQREVLLPAGTCFQVLEKSVSNVSPKEIKMKLKCLGQRNYFLKPTLLIERINIAHVRLRQ